MLCIISSACPHRRGTARRHGTARHGTARHVGALSAGLRLFSSVSTAPHHHAIIACNLFIASSLAGGLTELVQRGRSPMLFAGRDNAPSNAAAIAAWLVLAILYENVAEYYWHRTVRYDTIR